MAYPLINETGVRVSMERKVIIVEGQTDKRQLEKIIIEDIDIICTHGTFSIEKFDELLETYDLDYSDVYIFVDSDDSGFELRKQLTAELPHAEHIYVGDQYTEVATTPEHVLATQLLKKHIEIDIRWLKEVR